MFSCEYSRRFRGSSFYRTAPVAAFELRFSTQKKINIKKVQKEIAFALISLKHLHYKSLQADQPLESIGLCSKICWIFLSQKIWNKKSMTT